MIHPETTGRLDELEAQLDDQRETIERQQERIDGEAADVSMNRRTALQAGGGPKSLRLDADTASADAPGQIGTSSDRRNQLYTTELTAGAHGLTVTADRDHVLAHGSVTQSGIAVDGGGNVVAGYPLNSVDDDAGAVPSAIQLRQRGPTTPTMTQRTAHASEQSSYRTVNFADTNTKL